VTEKKIVEGEPPGTSSNPAAWPPLFRDPNKPKRSNGENDSKLKKRGWRLRRRRDESA
jgi:hypothetical protein